MTVDQGIFRRVKSFSEELRTYVERNWMARISKDKDVESHFVYSKT
jgi:hypothetical protein